jgi:hypothetical protein
MPRPKKKKVMVVEELPEAASSSGVEEHPPSSPAKTDAEQKPSQPPSPGRALRMQVGRELREDLKLFKYTKKLLADAANTYEVGERVFDAMVN